MAEEKTQVQNIADLLAKVRNNNAFLTVLNGTSMGQSFKLEAKELVIGRSSEADIQITDEGISRRHAKVVQKPDGTIQLVDLGSTNGTFFNGNRVDVHVLRDGDTVLQCKAGDADGLAATIRRGLDDAHLRARIGAAGRREQS